MPLLEQLTNLSDPGNPGGVCAPASAVSAYVLMKGADSLKGVTSLSLPLTNSGSGETVLDPQRVRTGGAPTGVLDVSRLPEGKPGVWKWEGGKGSELAGGKEMLGWLTKEARSGVYVGRVDDPDGSDPHFFNIAKTKDGKVYLVDSSMQNFERLLGPDDVGMFVTGQSEKKEEDGQRQELDSEDEFDLEDFEIPVVDEEVTNVNKVGKEIQNDSEEDEKVEVNEKREVEPVLFSQVYCSRSMNFDFCGSLDEGCAKELEQSLKRAVREIYQVSGSPPSTGRKHSVN